MTINKKMASDFIAEHRNDNVKTYSEDQILNYCFVLAYFCEDEGCRSNYDVDDLTAELRAWISESGNDEEALAVVLDEFTACALEDDLACGFNALHTPAEAAPAPEKVLYFEGAGWDKADISLATVGNCRIRTAFTLDNGQRLYLELTCGERGKSSSPMLYKWRYTGFVNFAHYITDEQPNDDCNLHSVPAPASFEYSFRGILRLVNSFGASFTRIEVINGLGCFRVFNDHGGYNYGDEFKPDHDLIENRNRIYKEIESEEISRGEAHPCFSLWVDENDPAVLHFRNFRKGGRLANDIIIFAGVPSDLSKLPTIGRNNAVVGAFYAFCNSAQQCSRLESISDDYARQNKLIYLDRFLFNNGVGGALSGSRLRSDLA